MDCTSRPWRPQNWGTPQLVSIFIQCGAVSGVARKILKFLKSVVYLSKYFFGRLHSNILYLGEQNDGDGACSVLWLLREKTLWVVMSKLRQKFPQQMLREDKMLNWSRARVRYLILFFICLE